MNAIVCTLIPVYKKLSKSQTPPKLDYGTYPIGHVWLHKPVDDKL